MEIQSAFAAGMQGLQRASNGVTEATLNINQQTQQNRNNAADAETQRPVAEAEQAENGALESAAQNEVAQGNAPSVESSLVELNVQELNAQANVRSIQSADEVLGTIVDIRA
ncbi:MAG: excinuclease ATPase subunit [Alkalimonas sp.]|nr:excinuclease ATPase subunit [Alkalimonas sp.]